MTKLAVIVNDLQVPFHDVASVKAVLKFVAEVKPDALVLNGDIGDFYEVSDFDKDPARKTNLQTELAAVRTVIDAFAAAAPKAKKFWNDGNHEDRLRRYLWKHPELASLETLTIPSQLKLAKYGFEYHPYGEGFWLNRKFFVVHGDIVRSKSSFTARAMYERYLCSGISGHTHRLGSYYNVAHTVDGPEVFGWWENGCLCAMTPEYVQHPQWQQGFAVVHYDDGPTGRFQVVQVPVLDGMFIYGGEAYGKRKT